MTRLSYLLYLLHPTLDRKSKSGDDTLATKLLQQQHAQATALANAFYSKYIVEAEGQFVAYKMVRTLVTHPLSYVGLRVEKEFQNGLTYKGTISEYYDHKQWWRVQFHDMDVEDWAVGDMMRWVPSFVCGAVLDGVTEFSANTVRQKNRTKRRHGRR